MNNIDYRNMFSKLYYKQYFEATMNYIKNTWKGIKAIITVKIHLLIFQSVYLPMVLQSQTKLKFQTSLIIILQQLLKKQT